MCIAIGKGIGTARDKEYRVHERGLNDWQRRAMAHERRRRLGNNLKLFAFYSKRKPLMTIIIFVLTNLVMIRLHTVL